MLETHFSCDTVDRGLWLAIGSSLLCPETDRNIRIGSKVKLMYFILLILRSDLFIGFVKFEIKQRFSAYQDQVCAWFSLARLQTEAARK